MQRIAFDIDGVLSLTDEKLLSSLQGRGLLTGRTLDDLRLYSWAEVCPDEITDDQIWEVLNVPGFYRDLHPCRDLIACFHCCRAAGYEIHIVTARCGPDHIRRETESWLAEYDLVPDHLVYCSPSQKADYAASHHLDLFLEDRVDTAHALVASGISTFVVHTASNRWLLPECRSWKDLLQPGPWRHQRPFLREIFQGLPREHPSLAHALWNSKRRRLLVPPVGTEIADLKAPDPRSAAAG